jgi:BirA family biotin operon repressor/biotin-[acetyl-CoA-carboxylase] ligase
VSTDLQAWADVLDQIVGSSRWFTRVVVLAETASTQDAARRLCAGRPGVVVVTTRQTAGRGRLGRSWVQPAGTGIALSCVLDPVDPGLRSLQAGLAAARACEDAVPAPAAIGLRWPNDVVTRAEHRKVAGVLVERIGSLIVAGIGMNVREPPHGWPSGLRATSLEALGSTVTCVEAAQRLVVRLDEALSMTGEDAAREWRHRDILIGLRATFEHDGRRYEGVVEAIEPASQIRLRRSDGEVVHLPALTTSLVAFV